MPESTQHKLDRVRPPRVQITYDVETRGSFVKKELPFVVGIMADLSSDGGAKDDKGQPIPLRDKNYLEIDRDNFGDIMASIKPSVGLDGKVASNGAGYTFESLEDFTPIRLLRPANLELNKLDPNDLSPLSLARADYERRTKLSDMVAKLDGNVPLQKKFLAALRDNNGQKLQDTMRAIQAEIKAQTEPLPATPELAKAEQAVTDAQGRVDAARTKLAAKKDEDEASKQVERATTSLTKLQKPDDPTDEQKQLTKAQEDLAAAEKALDQEQQKAAKKQLEDDAQKRLEAANKQLAEAKGQPPPVTPTGGGSTTETPKKPVNTEGGNN
jgi:type VI secretion system protein ImpB